MAQVARNLTAHGDGFLRAKRFLILDRDTKFTEQFRRILEGAGVTVVQAAYQAPDMNAIPWCAGYVRPSGSSEPANLFGSTIFSLSPARMSCASRPFDLPRGFSLLLSHSFRAGDIELLDLLANRLTPDEILAELPDLESVDIVTWLRYARSAWTIR